MIHSAAVSADTRMRETDGDTVPAANERGRLPAWETEPNKAKSLGFGRPRRALDRLTSD